MDAFDIMFGAFIIIAVVGLIALGMVDILTDDSTTVTIVKDCVKQ